METAQKELVDLAHQASKAQIATDVLHNVGNILSSVNTVAGFFREQLRNSCTTGISKTAALIRKHRDDLGDFITLDPKGKKLPEYVERLAEQTEKERALLEQSAAKLSKQIEHINAIISLQQSHSRTAGLVQETSLSETIADAICINEAGFERHAAEVETQLDELPPIRTDRHKILQILVNLLSNAKYAVSASETPDKRIWVRLHRVDEQRIRIEVEDNGVGIDPENMTKIFAYGFTTKDAGHGFGLHSSANAAKQIGATLTAHSQGVEQGATFTLDLTVEPFTHHTTPETSSEGRLDRGQL
jgi:signal transduction histidine kinase